MVTEKTAAEKSDQKKRLMDDQLRRAATGAASARRSHGIFLPNAAEWCKAAIADAA
jgi:hypothetical protein